MLFYKIEADIQLNNLLQLRVKIYNGQDIQESRQLSYEK